MGGFLTRRYFDCNCCDYSKKKRAPSLSLHRSNATLLYLNALSSSSYCSRTSIDRACLHCLGDSAAHRRRRVGSYCFDLHLAIIGFSGIDGPQMNRVSQLSRSLQHQVCSDTLPLLRLAFESNSCAVDSERESTQLSLQLSFLCVRYCCCFPSDCDDGSSVDVAAAAATADMNAVIVIAAIIYSSRA